MKMWRTMKVLNKFLYFFVFVFAVFNLFSSQTPSGLSALSANPASNLTTRENARSLTQAQRPNPRRPLQRGTARRFSQDSLKVVVDNLNVTPETKHKSSSCSWSDQDKLVVPKLDLQKTTPDNTSDLETAADSERSSSQEYTNGSDSEGETAETAQQRIDEFMTNVKEVVSQTVFEITEKLELKIEQLVKDYVALKTASAAIIEKLRTERKEERRRLITIEENIFSFKQVLNEPYKNIADYGAKIEKLNKTMLQCLDTMVTMDENINLLLEWKGTISKTIQILELSRHIEINESTKNSSEMQNKTDNQIPLKNTQAYWHWYSMNNPFLWVCLLLLFEHYDGRVLLCAMYNQLDMQNKLQSMQSYFS